jgi:hypothetical protein
MVAFLKPAKGGILPINGKNGSIINASANANEGRPGRQIIPHPINIIIADAQTAYPTNNCDPFSQLQKQQQRIQQQIQQAVEQQITANIQEGIRQNANIQNIQKQLQNLEQQKAQGSDVNQQIETAEKEAQSQLEGIIAGAIARASQQLPQAAKVANSTSSGLKPIASVAESLRSFVPSQGINMGNYGNSIKNVQQVSQGCFI